MQTQEIVGLVDFIKLEFVLILLTSVVGSLVLGYKLFDWFHKCKGKLKGIVSKYKNLDPRIQQLELDINYRVKRTKWLKYCLLLIYVALALYILSLILFIDVGYLWIALIMSVSIVLSFIIHYIRLVDKEALVKEKRKLYLLKGRKSSALMGIINDFPITEQKELQKKVTELTKKLISKNSVKIGKVEKECMDKSLKAEKYDEILNSWLEFEWCKYCKLMRKKNCKAKFAQCEVNCLNKHWELINELKKEKDAINNEQEKAREEIILLQEDEKVYEDNNESDIMFQPKKGKQKQT